MSSPDPELFGLRFTVPNRDVLFARLRKMQETGGLFFLVTVNAEFIVDAHDNDRFQKLICTHDACIDGQIPYWLATLRAPRYQWEKISGSDLIYELAAYAQDTNSKVFLLGGDTTSNSRAVEFLADNYGIAVSGYSPPFHHLPFPSEVDYEIRRQIRSFSPDLLVVCFGAQKQEFWIQSHYPFLLECGVNFVSGFGGTLDFVSGKKPRAPSVIQDMGLESLFRLMIEPSRDRLRRIAKSVRFLKFVLR